MEKIIIDTDPGIDDLFAILLAANSEELDIQALCTVAGNCTVNHATSNAFKALDLANKSSIPVYQGMKKAMHSEIDDASYVHGNNGMGDVAYEPIVRKPESLHAVDYLIKTVRDNPHQITLIAIGPLTNIACAIEKDPTFSKNVKQLIIMGGSTQKGNVTSYAEFNFYTDPFAAKIVFDSEFNKIVMMGLNVTTKLPLSENLESILQTSADPLARFLFQVTRKGAQFDRSKNYAGLILNDPLTIAYLIDPSIVELRDAEVAIETTGEKAGQSVVKFVNQSHCKVGYRVDCEKFYRLIFKKILNINL